MYNYRVNGEERSYPMSDFEKKALPGDVAEDVTETLNDGEETSVESYHGDDAYEGMLVVKTAAEEPRYEELFDAAAPRSRFLSVASLVLGIISVALSFTGWWVLIIGALAILASLASRKNLKYFDGMSIAGMMLGIFGMVFGLAVIFVLYGPFADAVGELFGRK